MSGDIAEPKKKRPCFNFKPWGWDQTFTLLTGIVAVIGAYFALNSEFFKVANERIGNEAVLAKITKERAETELQKINVEKEQLLKERDQLVADNKVLKEEIQGTNEEWEAIEKVSGPEIDLNIFGSGGYSSNITYYRPEKGFVFHLSCPGSTPNSPPSQDDETAKYIAQLRRIPKLRKIETMGYLITPSTMTDISLCDNVTTINLWNAGIDSQTLKNLSTLPKLKDLRLDNNSIVTLEGAKKQPALEILSLARNNITDDQVPYIIDSYPNLINLELTATQIGNDACKHLVKLPKLAVLSISSTKIDRSGLETLIQTSRPLTIFTGMEITAEDLDELAKTAKPNISIIHPNHAWKPKENK